MPTATVHVKFKDAPGQGKKNWKIKAADNNLYFLKPELADKVMIGGEYTFEYKTNAFNGQNFNMVDAVTASHPSSASPGSPHEAPSGGQHNSQKVAREIFFTTVWKEMIRSGMIKKEDLRTDVAQPIANFWLHLWDSTIGNPQPYAADMDERIPF